MRKLIILIIISVTARYSFPLKVFRSQLPIESTEGVAGLHYLKQNNENASFANNMTFCLRYNYKRILKRWTEVWFIGQTGKVPDDLSNALMDIVANYPNSWWLLAGNWWLLHKKFYTHQWQHMCIAYDKDKNSLTVIKVKENNTSPNLVHTYILITYVINQYHLCFLRMVSSLA